MYIVSWNFSHMVSPQANRQLEKAITALGFQAPILATPEEIYDEAYNYSILILPPPTTIGTGTIRP